MSDRRWKKIIKVLKTSAYINGRKQIDYKDIILIPYCSWNNEKEDKKKVEDIVKEVLFRILRIKIEKIKSIKKRFLAKEKQLSEQLKSINSEIEKLIKQYRENIDRLSSILSNWHRMLINLIKNDLKNIEDVKKNAFIQYQCKGEKIPTVINDTIKSDCYLILFYKMMVMIINYYYIENPPKEKNLSFCESLKKDNKEISFSNLENPEELKVEIDNEKNCIRFKKINSISLIDIDNRVKGIQLDCQSGYFEINENSEKNGKLDFKLDYKTFKKITFILQSNKFNYYDIFNKIDYIDRLINNLYVSNFPIENMSGILSTDNIDEIIQKIENINVSNTNNLELKEKSNGTISSKYFPNIIVQKLNENEIEEKIENIISIREKIIKAIKDMIHIYQKKYELQDERNKFINNLKKEINLLREPPLSYLSLAKELKNVLEQEIEKIEKELNEKLKNI